jgi:ribosomal protein S18 acetylase RimI-like enzyme
MSSLTPDADFFRALECRRTQALVDRDMERARSMHAPEYQLVTPGGRAFTREEYLGEIEAGNLPYAKWELGEIDVRVATDMAIVRYRARLEFASGRVVHCWHTDSYERRGAAWLAVWSQATGLAGKKAAAGDPAASCAPRSAIRPMTDADYATWLAHVVPAYAEDKVASGDWSASESLAKSQADYEFLLPQGRATPGHFLFSIVGEAGEPIGTIWFAIKEEGGKRIAYVYDIEVEPAHRRQGHARWALLAIEEQARLLGLAGVGLHVFGFNKGAQALYAQLGFEPTHINLYKTLEGAP